MIYTPANPAGLRPSSSGYYRIIFYRDEVLLSHPVDDKEKQFFIPGAALKDLNLPENAENFLYLGLLDEIPLFLQTIEEEKTAVLLEQRGYIRHNLRKLLPRLTSDETAAYFRANHLRLWVKESRFCGRCGGKMTFHKKETSRICPACEFIQYPRISPAVITRITRGNRILLAHNRNFRENIHSLIAGFVDPGESLEDTVIREIREEVGLEVKNIRYFSSQPWPFPNSLMCGFTAEWASGEIRTDDEEIDEAGWFLPGEFPPIPGTGSISRILIDDFLQNKTS